MTLDSDPADPYSLPQWLSEAMQAQVISPQEAEEIWNCWLLTPEGQSLPLPEELYPAASRLFLWEMEAAPTLH